MTIFALAIYDKFTPVFKLAKDLNAVFFRVLNSAIFFSKKLLYLNKRSSFVSLMMQLADLACSGSFKHNNFSILNSLTRLFRNYYYMDIQKLIKKKVDSCHEKLVLITDTVNSEMTKKIHERNSNLLDFLHKEKAVYKFSLAELNDLLNNLNENER